MIPTFLFDLREDWMRFLPLSYTRSIADMLMGCMPLHQRWAHAMGLPKIHRLSIPYLRAYYPLPPPPGDALFIRSTLWPNLSTVQLLQQLPPNTALLTTDTQLLALRTKASHFFAAYQKHQNSTELLAALSPSATQQSHQLPILLRNPVDLFRLNAQAFEYDCSSLVSSEIPSHIHRDNRIFGDQLYLLGQADIKGAIIDATQPVVIDHGAVIMPGAMLKGPIYIGPRTIIKMGARIYGPTSFGPYCKIGGEVNNSVVIGYSNKAHDGYLGNSVLGSWCNIGADTNTSNLKNNYSEVRIWSYAERRFVPSGTIFCGLIMGDHSKSGINVMFNTGTTVGVSCNIYGTGYPRTFIPSFSWGGPQGLRTYKLDKALHTASIVMQRRNQSLSTADVQILQKVFQLSAAYRNDD